MATSRMSTPGDQRLVREPGVQVDELIDGLRWPLIFRAARVGVRPGAAGLALVLIVILALLDRIPSWWRAGDGPITDLIRRVGTGVGRIVAGLISFDSTQVGDGASMLVRVPSSLLEGHAWGLLVLLPAIVVTAVIGGAVCRIAAYELARRQSLPWPSALGFALSRWTSLVGVLLGPALVVGGLALALGLAGMVLLGVPYLNVLGGLGYALLLLLGAVGVVAAVGYALGSPMLLPAVACEGSDAVDSMGRTFPYAVSRPIRLVVYLLLLVAMVWATSSVAHWAASSVAHFTGEAATGWAGPSAREGMDVALGRAPAVDATGARRLDGSWRYAAPLVGFWNRTLTALASAVTVAVFFGGSTAVYMLMRLVVDGQDPGEIWVPGEIEDTMARTQASRQTVVPVASAGASATGDAPPAADE